MLKKLLRLIFRFVYTLSLFNTNMHQTFSSSTFGYDSEDSFDTIHYVWKHATCTLGSLIDSNLKYKNPTLKDCLAYTLGKSKNGIISASTPQEIIKFFKEQDLLKHVKTPEATAEGNINTFCNTYGVEFPQHGPLEEKTIALVKTLAQLEPVNFLDFGAGYGKFAKSVHQSCAEERNRVTVCVNECLSVQCYHAAKLFEDREFVLIYPRDLILSGLEYSQLDRKFKISTIFNVHHFMEPFYFKKSIQNAYDITETGGYHIAIALSPYYTGDKSILAQIHDRRAENGVEYPGYITEQDVIQLELISLRAPMLFLSQEAYKKAFQQAGFEVVEVGYFCSTRSPREFSYIIAKKN